MQSIRVNNLKSWFSDKPLPTKEKSFFSQLINMKSSFGEKVARRIERDYGMPENYLDKENALDTNAIDDLFTIEVLDVTASAGDGITNTETQSVIKLIEYDKQYAETYFNGIQADKIKIINLKGDSMQGTFECGDSLYVDVSKSFFDGDGIYVFTFGRDLYVKRLQRVKNQLIVISDNPVYRDWYLDKQDESQLIIHGKIIFSQSMLLRRHG